MPADYNKQFSPVTMHGIQGSFCELELGLCRLPDLQSLLVLIHAGFADSRMWDDQWEMFTQLCRVLRFDQRGAGAGQASHRR